MRKEDVSRKDYPSYYTCGVPDIHKMTKEQLDAELQKGVDDIHAGRTMSAEEVFAELRSIIKK